jgi:hypothetical protein
VDKAYFHNRGSHAYAYNSLTPLNSLKRAKPGASIEKKPLRCEASPSSFMHHSFESDLNNPLAHALVVVPFVGSGRVEPLDSSKFQSPPNLCDVHTVRCIMSVIPTY